MLKEEKMLAEESGDTPMKDQTEAKPSAEPSAGQFFNKLRHTNEEDLKNKLKSNFGVGGGGPLGKLGAGRLPI